MHVSHGLAHAQKQMHELLLGEVCVIDQVRIDDVLQVSSSVIWQQNIYGL